MNERRGFPPLRQKQRRRKDRAPGRNTDPSASLRMTGNLGGKDREAVGTRLRASRWPIWRATGPGLPSTSSIIGRVSGQRLAEDFWTARRRFLLRNGMLSHAECERPVKAVTSPAAGPTTCGGANCSLFARAGFRDQTTGNQSPAAGPTEAGSMVCGSQGAGVAEG